MDLTGKNVVFVAGLGGIGYETCKQLMKRKLTNLVILEVKDNQNAIKELQLMNSKCTVRYIQCDVTDKASIKRAISQAVTGMTYIDVLVNGAGILADRNVELTINVNLVGLINTTFEALPYMDKTRNGRGGLIANIASVLGLEPGAPLAVYSASKFGVIGFTRSLADPYYFNRTGVAVTALCPGITETPLVYKITGRDTFDYSGPLTDHFLSCDTQTSAQCGEHLARVIEVSKNGSIWISDLGQLRLVESKVFWEMRFEKNNKA